jgi:protein phosphatase
MRIDAIIDEADDTTSEHVTIPRRAPRVRVDFGAVTHPGRVRGNNEDQLLVAKLAKSMRVCKTSLPEDGGALFADEEGYLMVVADGLGGENAGERASAMAVRSIERFVLDTLKWFLHAGGRDENALLDELRRAFERADREVVHRAQEEHDTTGMATTLTVAFSVATDLFIAHAGDSRAYLFHDGRLEQITTDHTLIQILVDAGAVAPEVARSHQKRHVVMNVIGGPQPEVRTEIHKRTIEDGDRLLLCSDGLTEPVEDEEIAALLLEHQDPEAAADALLGLALERGAPDNVTVVVARYEVD